MKLGKLSTNRFYHTAYEWNVEFEYAEVMHNYFVHGYSPGGFFTALLANDAFSALSRSHPGNTIPSLKSLVGWINGMPLRGIAYGSYEAVDNWLTATPDYRRKKLVEANLIFDEQDEIMYILRGEELKTPYTELQRREHESR
jgi:hypothetical protein